MFYLHLIIGLILENTKKFIARIERGNSNKILFLLNPYENLKEGEKLVF